MKKALRGLLFEFSLALAAVVAVNSSTASILITTQTTDALGTHIPSITIQEEAGPRETHVSGPGVVADAFVSSGSLHAYSRAIRLEDNYLVQSAPSSTVRTFFTDSFRISGGTGRGILNFSAFSASPFLQVGCDHTTEVHSVAAIVDQIVVSDGQNRTDAARLAQRDCYSILSGISAGSWQSDNIMTSVSMSHSGMSYVRDYWQQSIPLQFEFSFGADLQLYMNLDAYAGVGWGGAGYATADGYHSSYWGGILGITDLNGNPITDYTVTSASGTDYRSSFVPTQAQVPEPGSLGLVALALLGVITLRRRH